MLTYRLTALFPHLRPKGKVAVGLSTLFRSFHFLLSVARCIKRSNNMKKPPRCELGSGSWISIPRLALFFLLALSFLPPGISSSRIVTLGSIEIFNTHEWFPSKPTIYFKCQEGNKTTLPDVTKPNILYIFKGEESWQPLTELPDKKCKRCGLYEADTIKNDDVFDEWELCASDFVDGRYIHFKENEFNATFICPGCTGSAGSNQTSISKKAEHKSHVIIVILISLLASIVATGGAVVIYIYWQKRKREQDQARFLKLFDEGDDLEDELDLGHL